MESTRTLTSPSDKKYDCFQEEIAVWPTCTQPELRTAALTYLFLVHEATTIKTQKLEIHFMFFMDTSYIDCPMIWQWSLYAF